MFIGECFGTIIYKLESRRLHCSYFRLLYTLRVNHLVLLFFVLLIFLRFFGTVCGCDLRGSTFYALSRFVIPLT